MTRHGWILCGWLIVDIALGSACSTATSVDSCADSLTGVWVADTRARSGERFRFHIVDRESHVEILPMFDDSHPPTGHKAKSDVAYAPASFEVLRMGRTLVGDRSQRVERGGRMCTLSDRASIRACKRDTLELSWVQNAHIDWQTCRTMSASRRMRVRLARQR